jgi:hypothetical protein
LRPPRQRTAKDSLPGQCCPWRVTCACSGVAPVWRPRGVRWSSRGHCSARMLRDERSSRRRRTPSLARRAAGYWSRRGRRSHRRSVPAGSAAKKRRMPSPLSAAGPSTLAEQALQRG